MAAIPNHALRQLRAGKLAIGLGVQKARVVDIAMMAKTCGFDWLFIDGEHGALDLDTASQISTAALPVGVTPVVRVAGFEHWHASRILDNGAQGIVFPHVDNHEQAQRVADACRFPPVGKRSMGGGLAQVQYQSIPIGEAARLVNEETLVVAMIESPAGVANAGEIAAVKGVDALLIGTNDLCFELGIPGQFDDPRVAEAYTKVIAACRKHGKFPGMGGLYTPALLERHIGMGVQLVLSGSDFSFLMQAGAARAQLVRGFEKREWGNRALTPISRRYSVSLAIASAQPERTRRCGSPPPGTLAQPPCSTNSAWFQVSVALNAARLAGALPLFWNCATQTGTSEATIASSARAAASSSAVLPVTQPPQAKPTMVMATAPQTAPQTNGSVFAGRLGIFMVEPLFLPQHALFALPALCAGQHAGA